jgi:hypothetical protein
MSHKYCLSSSCGRNPDWFAAGRVTQARALAAGGFRGVRCTPTATLKQTTSPISLSGFAAKSSAGVNQEFLPSTADDGGTDRLRNVGY